MSRSRYFSIALLLSAFGLNILPLGLPMAQAQTPTPAPPTAPAETVRPEVGKPLQAAVDLYKEKKYKEALTKLGEISVGDKTPFELYMIDRIRAAVASAAEDNAMALEALNAVVASGKAPAEEQKRFIFAIGDLYYHKPDYGQAAAWFSRYLKEGGSDSSARDYLVQSYYLNNDFAHASEELQANLAAQEKAGVAPTETQLRLLFSIAAKQNDKAAYVLALEKMVTYYPKKEYWNDLLNRMHAKSNFSQRLDLDFYRLKFSMGLLSKPAEFTDMAELAMVAGFPAEAKKVLEAANQAGAVGVGPDLDRQKRLLDLTTKKSAEDLNTIAQTETEVRKTKDGIGYFNLGYVFVTNGQFDKGIALMEQGMNIGGLKHPDEAKLRLATAYVMAGRGQNAIQEFKTVQGVDGSADLARYWVTQLMHPLS